MRVPPTTRTSISVSQNHGEIPQSTGRKSFHLEPTKTTTTTTDPAASERKRISISSAFLPTGEDDNDKDTKYQLRQIKKNWDTSYVPKGSVLDRIKVFSHDGQKGKDEELELTNTGRTNPALKKRREMERQLELERQRALAERQRAAQGKYGLGRTKKQRDMAATAIQCIVRMKHAKGIAARKREQAAARLRAEVERKRQGEAAIKIQAIMRSALARMRVYRMLDQMIADLAEQQNAEERRIQQMEEEAAAKKAAAERAKEEARRAKQAEKERLAMEALAKQQREAEELEMARQKAAAELRQKQEEEERMALAAIARQQREAEEAEEMARQKAAAELKHQQEEEERLAMAALAREHREAEIQEMARQKAAAELKRQQEEEEERMALAAMAHNQRDATAHELADEKAAAEEDAEAKRLALLQEKKAKKEAEALERERRRKAMNLFVGPLPWGVGLLPDWWMEAVPHRTLQLDSISEEDNGEGFEEWRTSNVQNKIY